MSDPTDIKALDEYLKGGSDISQRYRELGREDVPPELDRRVLDAAHAAVASGKGARSRSWLKWSAPLAVAASVVLVVTVVIESGVQNDASFANKVAQEKPVQPQPQAAPPAQFVPDEPAALQAAPAAPPAAEPETLAKSAKLAKTEEAERANNAVAEEVRVDAKALRDEIQAALPVSTAEPAIDTSELATMQAAPAPSLAGATSVQTVSARKEVDSEASTAQADSADDELSTTSATGTRARRAGRTAGPRSTSTSSALSTETRPAADEDTEHDDPVKWLEEIRDLRRAGKSAEADRAWEHFHEAFPDFPVAQDDLARKK